MNLNTNMVVPPVGSVTAFLGDLTSYTPSPPQSSSTSFGLNPVEAYGWMVCDGRALKIDHYPELYAMIGTIYGGDENTFNLPDLRGMFLRGVGSDPASTENRQKPNQGSGSETGVGSTQDFAIQTHVHKYTIPQEGGLGGNNAPGIQTTAIAQTAPPSESDMSISVKVSQLETRPSNVFVYYIIKYTNQLPNLNTSNS